MLGACDSDRDRQPDLLSHPTAYRRRDLLRRTEQPRRSCNFQEGLVDRDALDLWREICENVDHPVGQTLVFSEVPRHELQLGTQFPGLTTRHPAPHPELPGLVRSCEDDSASDRDRPSSQPGVQ